MPQKKDLNEMTEGERGDFYAEHKDDDSFFSHKAVELPGRRQGTASTMFSLRIPADELKRISAAARARGLSVSEFIRRAALAETDDGESRSRAEALAKARTKARELAETLARL